MITNLNLEVSRHTAENMESRHHQIELIALADFDGWSSKYGYPINKVELEVLNKMGCRLGKSKYENINITQIRSEFNFIMPILRELWKKYPREQQAFEPKWGLK